MPPRSTPPSNSSSKAASKSGRRSTGTTRRLDKIAPPPSMPLMLPNTGGNPSFMEGLQELALATRLKKLSDQIYQAWVLIYQTQNTDLEPSWFMVFYLLTQQAPLSLMEIAQQLTITHSAVSQVVSELTKHGLVEQIADKTDKRKRLVQLTPQGQQTAQQLMPVWEDLRSVLRELVMSTGYDLLDVLHKTEQALEAYPLSNRFFDRLVDRQVAQTRIVPYQPAYKADFERLNRFWLEQFFSVEPIDELYFQDPEGTILAAGGHIFFAEFEGRLVGTCALLPHPEEGVVEFGKMGVEEAMQGRGIGELLVQAALNQAKADGHQLIYLEMNSRFIRSIQLYRKFGFILAPFDQPPKYQRSNVLLKRSLLS